MGLDIYFYSSNKTAQDLEAKIEVGYFRKVNALISWIHRHIAEVENCEYILINKHYSNVEHKEHILQIADEFFGYAADEFEECNEII